MTTPAKKEISLESHKENIHRLAQITELVNALTVEKKQLEEKIVSELPLDSIGLLDDKKVCTLSKVESSITVPWTKLPEDIRQQITDGKYFTERKESQRLTFDWKNIAAIFSEES